MTRMSGSTKRQCARALKRWPPSPQVLVPWKWVVSCHAEVLKPRFPGAQVYSIYRRIVWRDCMFAALPWVPPDPSAADPAAASARHESALSGLHALAAAAGAAAADDAWASLGRRTRVS